MVAGYILAAGGELGGLVYLLVLVAIGIISAVAKKKQQQEADERRSPPRRDTAQRGQRSELGPPQQRPATPAERQSLVSAALRSMGIEVPTPPEVTAPTRPRPRAAPRRQVQRAMGDGVNRHVEEHIDRAVELEASGAEVRQHVQEHMQPSMGLGQARAERGRSRVRLTAEQARRAIIYHEIFSPPKALRTEGDLWDQ